MQLYAYIFFNFNKKMIDFTHIKLYYGAILNSIMLKEDYYGYR